ncbi:MAG TPA: Ig-like domain-containing protein, partial [Kofleriaceae bacterium]
MACGDNRDVNYSPTLNNPSSGGSTSQALKTSEGSSITIDIRATDPEGDPLTYAVSVEPQHGTVAAATAERRAAEPGLFTYTPARTFTGMDTMQFTISDGMHTITVPVGVTVTPVNGAPVASPQSVVTNENQGVAIALVATDPDADPLVYTIDVPPSHGVLSGTAPHVTYTPAAGYFGADSFTFHAFDGQLSSNQPTVSIQVSYLQTCGDGIVQGAEQCDDGNKNNADACLNNCMTATCGDGVVGPGEECDDGNQSNSDACL